MEQTLKRVSDCAPLVTVGIPTYNRPSGLERTLRQICGQTHANLEILISDNCSTTPETTAVALAFQRSDARVRYIRQPNNLGIDANFKYLLEQATGEFFFWAADDDERTPDFVAACLENIGTAGLVMTGMRNAVRTRGLLRWKPPLNLSPSHSPFQDAVAFFNNLQPSLFYGMHRTKELRGFLQEYLFDYYDCFFILRRILTDGVRTVPKVCFHVGIDSEEPVYKPARPRNNAVYEYLPFLRNSIRAVTASKRLHLGERIRLVYLLCYVAINEFAHFEREARPLRARLALRARRAMRLGGSLLRIPLPPPPPTMKLPDDPAELCTMFYPREMLDDRGSLESACNRARADLTEKLTAIENIEACTRWIPKRTPRPRAALLQQLSSGQTMGELRRRFGELLGELETQEAYVQRLLRLQRIGLRRSA